MSCVRKGILYEFCGVFLVNQKVSMCWAQIISKGLGLTSVNTDYMA